MSGEVPSTAESTPAPAQVETAGSEEKQKPKKWWKKKSQAEDAPAEEEDESKGPRKKQNRDMRVLKRPYPWEQESQPIKFPKTFEGYCPNCGKENYATHRCTKEYIPNLILRCEQGMKERFEELFESDYKEDCSILISKKESRLVLIKAKNPKDMYHKLYRDVRCNRYVTTLYYADGVTGSAEDMITKMAPALLDTPTAAAAAADSSSDDQKTATATSSKRVRLVCWPKELNTDLTQLFDKKLPQVCLDPRDPTHVLFVVFAYGRVHYGLETSDFFYGNISNGSKAVDLTALANVPDAICRAYWKLREVIEGYDFELKEGMKGIDIGASPGGWSIYLANRGVDTLSVDPGALVVSHPRIHHVQKLIENAGDELKAHGELDVVVCDMNMDPRRAARIVLSIAHLCKPGSLLVFTAKLLARGVSKMMEECLGTLGDAYEVLWVKRLFSNGKERTVVARRKAEIKITHTLEGADAVFQTTVTATTDKPAAAAAAADQPAA